MYQWFPEDVSALMCYFSSQEFGDNMEMSMELTMACATNITIMPGLLDKGSQDKENTSGMYTI